jgi:hypothetical protein
MILQDVILQSAILQGVILQGVTSKTTAIWSYRMNYIQIQNVISKLRYFNRQYTDLLEESKFLDLVDGGRGGDKLRCAYKNG